MTCGLAMSPSANKNCDHGVASGSRFARVPSVSSQREQEKQHAEQVLALGHPHYRFDVDGVQRKQRRHHEAAACGPGRLQQDPEQQRYIERMQQYIGAVMASRIELKELAIQGVREPGHGMPIGLIVSGESPRDRVPGEPGLNVEVLGDIAVVVVIDERVMNRRIVKNDGGDHEDKTENKGSLLARVNRVE